MASNTGLARRSSTTGNRRWRPRFPGSSCRRPAQAGFTLMELVLCMLVLAVAIPPLINVFAEGATDTLAPLQISRANWLAIEKVEDILADRFSPSRGWSYLFGSNYPTESSVTGFPGYSRTVTITEVAGSDLITPQVGSDFKRINVSVSWTQGISRTVMLSYVVVQ